MPVVPREGARRARVAAAAALGLALLAVLAQLLLPGLAATRVRERVARYGEVRSVRVSAFPAVELLWGKADSVSVSAGTLAATPRQLGKLLWEARDLGTLTVTARTGVLRAPQLPAGLTMSDVRVQERGRAVGATATLSQAQIDASLPSGFFVQPWSSASGEVTVRASGGLFGLQASATATVRAVEGALVAEPRGLPLGGIARVTLLSDPHLKVGGVALRVVGRSPLVYGVAVWGSLR
jgi:hypothetical protein